MRPFADPIYVTRPILPPLDDLTARLRDVWESQWLTNRGAQHAALESALRRHLNVPHLSLFNNGTTALATALKALDLSGEVITTPFTFPATPHALLWNNLTPVFADIDPDTMNIAPHAIEAAIGPGTTAILAVHVYGTPCDWQAIDAIAGRHGLKVIYDAAHAFGVTVDGNSIGAIGDAAMFSFHATKMFHTAEGGALTTRDAALKERFDLLCNFGITGEDGVVEAGLNGKLNEIQSALGLLVLDHVAAERRKRTAIKSLYAARFARVPGLNLLQDPAGVEGSFQHLAVRIDERPFGETRNDVYDRLRKFNVFARKYFSPLCSSYPHFSGMPSAAAANLPAAHRVADEILCLPFYGALSEETVAGICDIVLAERR